MALETLLGQERESPITEQDRIDQTRVMVERTFGTRVEEIGTVETRDGQAGLVVSYQGREYFLVWKRQPTGPIFWYANDYSKPFRSGDQMRALARLGTFLDGVPTS